jgi:hypothetical protein
MEAACFSEIVVSAFKTVRCQNPETHNSEVWSKILVESKHLPFLFQG